MKIWYCEFSVVTLGRVDLHRPGDEEMRSNVPDLMAPLFSSTTGFKNCVVEIMRDMGFQEDNIANALK